MKLPFAKYGKEQGRWGQYHHFQLPLPVQCPPHQCLAAKAPATAKQKKKKDRSNITAMLCHVGMVQYCYINGDHRNKLCISEHCEKQIISEKKEIISFSK